MKDNDRVRRLIHNAVDKEAAADRAASEAQSRGEEVVVLHFFPAQWFPDTQSVREFFTSGRAGIFFTCCTAMFGAERQSVKGSDAHPWVVQSDLQTLAEIAATDGNRSLHIDVRHRVKPSELAALVMLLGEALASRGSSVDDDEALPLFELVGVLVPTLQAHEQAARNELAQAVA